MYFNSSNVAISRLLTTITTTINVPLFINKIYGNTPFNLNATSNSSAPFFYNSSNYSVAVVDSNGLVILNSSGTSIITTSQNAISGYTDASQNTLIFVDENSSSNPVLIDTSQELEYFLTTNASYGKIDNNLTNVTSLINLGDSIKIFINTSDDFVSITK